MTQLYPTSQMLAKCITFGASPNKAIVGANAFAHAAGIHQHGVMANPLTYEIMTPESVGVALELPGPRQTLRPPRPRPPPRRTRPALSNREQLDDVYARFTELADRKKTIYDQDLLGLLQPGEDTVSA